MPQLDFFNYWILAINIFIFILIILFFFQKKWLYTWQILLNFLKKNEFSIKKPYFFSKQLLSRLYNEIFSVFHIVYKKLWIFLQNGLQTKNTKVFLVLNMFKSIFKK
jgi:hypothetical protein